MGRKLILAVVLLGVPGCRDGGEYREPSLPRRVLAAIYRAGHNDTPYTGPAKFRLTPSDGARRRP